MYNGGRYELKDEDVNFIVYILEINTAEQDKKNVLELMIESKTLTESDLKDIAKKLIEKVGEKNE